MAGSDYAVVDEEMRHDKRAKAVHRAVIASTRGPLQLTLPVAKTGGKTWSQIVVSDHGRWWEVHRGAIESAYGRTPYFEFYKDRIFRHLTPEAASMPVTLLTALIDAEIRAILGITTRVSSAAMLNMPVEHTDLRKYDFEHTDIGEYPQIRQSALGYIPCTSILDMLFNLGPDESLVRLRTHI